MTLEESKAKAVKRSAYGCTKLTGVYMDIRIRPFFSGANGVLGGFFRFPRVSTLHVDEYGKNETFGFGRSGLKTNSSSRSALVD